MTNNLKDSAFIGSYSSTKLLITGFDIQRTQEKNVQQGKYTKHLGKARQNIRITLDGRLTCNNFDDLEMEQSRLLDALNKGIINLVIGATPDRFYRVVWSGAGLARHPGTGGPNLPFSLEFECIDSGAIMGVPAMYGVASIPGIPFSVDSDGFPAVGDKTFIGARTIYGYGLSLENDLGGISLTIDSGTATLTVEGETQSWPVPEKSGYHLALVFSYSGKIKVYIDGRPYTNNPVSTVLSDPVSWKFGTFIGAYYGVLAFPATDKYALYLSMLGTDSIINGIECDGSTSFDYKGMDDTPVSIYTNTSASYTGIRLNDFGARYTGNTWFCFNGLTGETLAGNQSYLDSITYNGGFTLNPRIKTGNNVLNRTEGSVPIYMFWRRMVR